GTRASRRLCAVPPAGTSWPPPDNGRSRRFTVPLCPFSETISKHSEDSSSFFDTPPAASGEDSSSPPQAARIPTASRFVFPRWLRWVPPTTALLQRRTTKRLYFWAARP